MRQAFSQTQRTSQIQAQKISQKQIQSLKLLAMSAEDLREEIYAEAEKNPALEIASDNFENGVQNVRVKKNATQDYLRIGQASASGEEKSQAFQEILEAQPDERKTLRGHLLQQLSLAKISQKENALCQKIIGNLDERGFFILAPVSLLNPAAGETLELLEKCISIVQNFDPSGICVTNAQESLLLQARQKDPPPAAIFLLSDHLDFLNPPQAKKVLKKIRDYMSRKKNLSFNKTDFSEVENFREIDIQNAINFIQSLDPFPARNFFVEQTHFILPDIFVEKIPLEDMDSKKNFSFKIKISDKIIPKIKISSEFADAQKNSEFAKAAVKQASVFLESLEFREQTIAKAAQVIVQRQKKFFECGEGNLSPLRLQDVAAEIGVHESTISRMALSKYIQCEWGLFPVKYFFTNSVATKNSKNAQLQNEIESKNEKIVSQESAKFAIQKIVLENADKKNLSDQKIAQLLLERGIKISRRTVAKYRAQMNVASSYCRK